MSFGRVEFDILAGSSSSTFPALQGQGTEASKKLSSFHNQIFNPSSTAPSRLLSGGALSGEDVKADISSIPRSYVDYLSSMHPTQNIGAAYHVMGSTTAVNLLQALFSLQKDMSGFAQAKKIGDLKGMQICREDIAARMGQIMGGGGYIIYRMDQIAAGGFHVTSKGFAEAGKWSFFLGNIGFGLFFAIATWMCGKAYFRNESLLQKLNSGNGSDSSRIKVLLDLMKEAKSEAPSGSLREEASQFLGAQFEACVKELINTCHSSQEDLSKWRGLIQDVEKVSSEEWKKLGSQILEFCEKENSPELLLQLGFDGLDLKKPIADQIGEMSLKIKSSLVKEAELSRIIGSKNLAALKNAQKNGLLERLSSKDENVRVCAELEAQKILKAITTSVSRSSMWNGIMAASCFIGTAIMIAIALSFGVAILLNPYALMAIAVISIICYVGMLIGDGGFWWDGMHADAPVGTSDRAYSYAGLALSVASTGLALAFCSTPLGLATILVIGVLWIAVDLISLHLLNERDKKFKAEHPELLDFEKEIQALKAIQEKAEGERTWKERLQLRDSGLSIFQKLSTLQKEQMYHELVTKIQSEPFREEKLVEKINKRLGGELLKAKGEEFESLSFAACRGKEFCETHPNSPVIGTVQIAFRALGYDKVLLDKEVEERFYKAIYDQVAKEIRSAIYEMATIEDLEQASNQAKEGLKQRATLLQNTVGVKNRSSWRDWASSFSFATTS